MIFEDKLIVDNALALWVSCIMEKSDLVKTFFAHKDPTPEEFILSGLLFCKEARIRELFKETLSQLAHKVAREKGEQSNLLEFMLQLLSDKFTLISKYDSKQYFELFCDLIDYYFLNTKMGG